MRGFFMRASVLIASPFILLFASTAWAENQTVVQQGKAFAQTAVTINKGDTVTFTNQDPVTHNVYSQTSGMAFDLKTQKPGASSEVKFDRVGAAEVRCAIHPQMKMTVTVK
jgi:plastocyanin